MTAGTLVVLGPRSLVKDVEDCWVPGPMPGGLADDLGARVVEGLSQTLPVTVTPGAAPAGPWTDVLETTASDTTIEATYGGETYLAGSPAAVRRGRLAYVGCSSVDGWVGLLARWLPGEGVPVMDADARLERFVRGSRVVAIDHAALSIDGLPLDPAGST